MSENLNNECGVCKIPCERKCSSCKLIYYCCEEHQKSDWTVHKAVCRPFKICESNELGRYLCATRDINVGDVIFSELPFVVGPKTQLLHNGLFPCVGCCKPLNLNKFEKCPECFWPVCNKDCEGLKINCLHGFECKILKMRTKIEGNPFLDYFRYDILIPFRTLLLQKSKPEKWEELMNLEAHLEHRNSTTETYKTVQEKIHYLRRNYLKRLEECGQNFFSDITDETIHKIYGIFDVNATELSEENADALILYPTASLLEHNCTPNTRQTIQIDNKFRITVRAALPIKDGDHITSIYTHILWGTHARQQHLQQNKYFTCTCDRCTDPTEFKTYLSALKCLGTEKERCGGTQLPLKPIETFKTVWKCDKCNIELPADEIIKFVDHLSDEVDKILARKPVLEQLEEFLNKLLNFLHENHYLVYSIRHSLVQLYGRGDLEVSDSILKEKLKICEDLISVTRKIDPGNARLSLYLGVLLNELFYAKFKLLNRSFQSENKNQFSNEIENISHILRDNKNVLENEHENHAGGKLYGVVEENERKFTSWMTQNNINVSDTQ